MLAEKWNAYTNMLRINIPTRRRNWISIVFIRKRCRRVFVGVPTANTSRTYRVYRLPVSVNTTLNVFNGCKFQSISGFKYLRETSHCGGKFVFQISPYRMDRKHLLVLVLFIQVVFCRKLFLDSLKKKNVAEWPMKKRKYDFKYSDGNNELFEIYFVWNMSR